MENIFNSEKELKRKYGNDSARKIMNRMAILKEATTLLEVPIDRPDRCHELKGDRKGQFSVDIKQPYRIYFKPNHNPIPFKQDGGIDLAKVTAIIIIEVEDPH
jgi:toxin HigB-1